MLKKPDSNIKIWNETLNMLKKQKQKRKIKSEVKIRGKIHIKLVEPTMVQHLDDLGHLPAKILDEYANRNN